MISIRDADKQKLIEARKSLVPSLENLFAREAIRDILRGIEDLSHQAPVLEPRIVPMTEEDKRICYPERYK